MNPEVRAITAREFVDALERDGFQWTRSKGSHRIYRHADGRRVVVSFHRPGGGFPPGTLLAMLRGTKWNNDDFERLGLVRRAA